MERLATILFLCISCPLLLVAQAVKVEFDKTTTAQVINNTSEKEASHLTYWTASKGVSKKYAENTALGASYMVLRQTYHNSMHAVSEFNRESIYVRKMIALQIKLMQNLKKAIKVINSSQNGKLATVAQKVHDLKILTDIGLKISSLYAMVSSISWGRDEPAVGENDGYNFVSRGDRMKLYRDVYNELSDINHQLIEIIYTRGYANNCMSVIKEISPKTWIKLQGGRVKINYIIHQLKNL